MLIATSSIAGFGKSILSAALIQHIKATPELSLGFCFSSSHAQSIHDMDGIIRTWTTQLIRQNKISLDLTFQMYQTRKTRRASRDDAWMILKDITTQIPRCVLVLDGLDEFRSDDDRRSQFLGSLKHTLQGTNARILITSRTEFDIESGLRISAIEPHVYSLLDCNISRQLVKDDIDLVSKYIVAKKLPKQEPNLREELAVQMAEKCDGQFLWLKFQQDLLRDSKSPKALRAVVQAMPQKLHAVYERSWRYIVTREEPDCSRAIDTLRWLAFAYRPLTVQELAEALVVSLDQSKSAFSEDDLPSSIDGDYIDGELKNLCGSLIEFREDTEGPSPGSTTVRLVHASVHDYLVGKLPLPSFVGSIPESCLSTAQHAQLAAHCIRFLDCDEAWVSDAETPRSFTKYAAESWFRHLQDSGNHFRPITTLVNNFLRRGNPHFDKWRVVYEQRRESSVRKRGTSFYYACLFGLVPAMEFLRDSEDHLDLNVRGGEYCTPLQAVCSTRNKEAFDRLIQWQADITIRGGRFGNAFNAAAYHNNIDMMKGLIARGSPSHMLSTEMHGALTTAAGQGHQDIVEFLLNQGANNDSSKSHSLYMGSRSQPTVLWQLANPLHAAAASSHLSVVKLLLKRGADVNGQVEDGCTALNIAVAENCPDIVEFLLDYDADPNIAEPYGGALHIAARRGHLHIATQLIESQATVDLQDRLGMTPLRDAAENGHVKVVEYLCTRGADINTQSSSGWTPLHGAAAYGHTETAACLIGEGADVNLHTIEGMAALHTAIDNGHSEMASMLLRAGTTLNSANDGSTPLHLAARFGIPELIIPLIQAGADRDAQSHVGSTPLHHAARHKHPKVVDLLLDCGAVFKADSEGWTPLHNAAFAGSLEIINRLLNGGADLYARHSRGWTPLHLAATHDSPNIIAFLIDQGSNLDAQTDDGFTALSIAVANNNPDVFDLLMSRGADVNVIERTGKTALHEAAYSKRMKFVQSLVESGCDVNAISTDGNTPLKIAIGRGGSDEIIKYLIQSGADLETADCFGMRSLDWLQRSRPNLKISRSTIELVHDDSSSPNMAVLRRTIVRLAAQLKEADSETRSSDLYILARCFLLLGIENDARLIYQNFLLPPEVTAGGYECDGCPTSLNANCPFFICKTCPDNVFCQRCILGREKKEDLSNHCQYHDFIEVSVLDAKFTPNDTEVLNGWLDKISEQFRDL